MWLKRKLGTVLFFVFVVFGFWCATKLVAIPNIQIFKVLNIIGLVFDLAGVAILSKFITDNERFKAFIVDSLALYISIFLLAVPIGMILGTFFSPSAPSQEVIRNFAMGLVIYCTWPIILTNLFVVGENGPPRTTVEFRVNLIGAFFLASGLIVQLVAAVSDLYSK